MVSYPHQKNFQQKYHTLENGFETVIWKNGLITPCPILLEQINNRDCNDANTLLNRYESVLSAQMTKSLGKSIINLYSNIACSVLGVGNQQELSTDLECDPFLNTAMQRFTCDLYYRFGAMLAPISVGIITGKHYAKILSLN